MFIQITNKILSVFCLALLFKGEILIFKFIINM